MLSVHLMHIYNRSISWPLTTRRRHDLYLLSSYSFIHLYKPFLNISMSHKKFHVFFRCMNFWSCLYYWAIQKVPVTTADFKISFIEISEHAIDHDLIFFYYKSKKSFILLTLTGTVFVSLLLEGRLLLSSMLDLYCVMLGAWTIHTNTAKTLCEDSV